MALEIKQEQVNEDVLKDHKPEVKAFKEELLLKEETQKDLFSVKKETIVGKLQDFLKPGTDFKNDNTWTLTVQTALNLLGKYDTTATKTIDGIYGDGTANAVKAFQKENGISETGFAGPKTMVKLIDAIYAKDMPELLKKTAGESANEHSFKIPSITLDKVSHNQANTQEKWTYTGARLDKVNAEILEAFVRDGFNRNPLAKPSDSKLDPVYTFLKDNNFITEKGYLYAVKFDFNEDMVDLKFSTTNRSIDSKVSLKVKDFLTQEFNKPIAFNYDAFYKSYAKTIPSLEGIGD